jgi:hypothetical protein
MFNSDNGFLLKIKKPKVKFELDSFFHFPRVFNFLVLQQSENRDNIYVDSHFFFADFVVKLGVESSKKKQKWGTPSHVVCQFPMLPTGRQHQH